jgi:hypothetical protein
MSRSSPVLMDHRGWRAGAFGLWQDAVLTDPVEGPLQRAFGLQGR